NCGSSVPDVAECFRRLEATNVSPNVATLIGHGTIRDKAMGGSFPRPPTDEELGKMKTMVEQAMKDGAVGLSTGLIYLPGTFAKTEEIIELAKVASRYGGIYASHIRNEEAHVVDTINEAISVGEQAKMPVEISHFKISAKSLWGQKPMTIGLVKA